MNRTARTDYYVYQWQTFIGGCFLCPRNLRINPKGCEYSELYNALRRNYKGYK